MKYNFDEIIDRHGTDSVKWDAVSERWGRNDLLPMWVADMDFRTPPFVMDALKKRLEHEILGYTFACEEWYTSIINWLQQRYHWEVTREMLTFMPGIVRGLAWTAVGGETLEVEVGIMPGNGKLLLTGKLGDVMKESAQIALTYVRSQTAKLVKDSYYAEHDIHIHVPEGAVPKDGPSAGVTMATALYSAVTGWKVRADIAMTGEISLRGSVLAIGGLKEKMLAAKAAGIAQVFIPKDNESDLAEFSEDILEGITVTTVSSVKEIWKQSIETASGEA